MSILHIAGTKGKGSTSAFTESILRENGLRTGLYTSPHLVYPSERIRLNGKIVPDELFVKYFWEVYRRLEATKQSPDEPLPGFFRFLTLLALHVFQSEGVDVAILEVGLGGRLDATNVFARPVATAITSLGYDHTNILGATLYLIAGEKAGVMRADVPCFTLASQKPEAMQRLREVAAERRTPLVVLPPLTEPDYFPGLQLGLSGKFQEENAALAAALAHRWLEARAGRPAPASPSEPRAFLPAALSPAFVGGLGKVYWPGRCQVYQVPGHNITFFLDGAHTPESMAATAEWFKTAASAGAHRVLYFNCATTREPEILLQPLSAASLKYEQSLFSTFDLDSKAAPTDWQQLAASTWQRLSPGTPAAVADCVTAAFQTIYSLDRPDRPVHVHVCGSLYLVGAIFELLQIPTD